MEHGHSSHRLVYTWADGFGFQVLERLVVGHRSFIPGVSRLQRSTAAFKVAIKFSRSASDLRDALFVLVAIIASPSNKELSNSTETRRTPYQVPRSYRPCMH